MFVGFSYESENKSELEAEANLNTELVKLLGYLVLFVLLLAPTVWFVLLYLIVYSITCGLTIMRYYEGSWSIGGMLVMLVILWGVFWYLLQARELKRFYEQ